MNKLPLFLDIGSLVRTNGPDHPGKMMGIVTRLEYRWPDPREEEQVATVLYPATGDEVEWREFCLEVVG